MPLLFLSLYESLSCPDFSVLDKACAFLAPNSPLRPTPASEAFIKAEALVQQQAWSPDEDRLVFGATPKETKAIEKRKGPGCLKVRRRVLEVLGVRRVEDIRRGWPWA